MSKLNIDMIREIKNNHPAVPEPFLNESKLLDVEEDCRKAFLSSRTGRLGAFGKAFHSFILEISSISLLFLSVCLFFFEFRRRKSEAHG